MNENNESERKDMRRANLLLAVILGLIALTVALMPFFYLGDQVK